MRKVRAQIQLAPGEQEALRAYARRRGISVSHAVREAVRRLLGIDEGAPAEMQARFLRTAGIGREPDSRRDVARSHDELLYGEAE